MARPSTFSVALDLNGTGTLVDVSSYLESEEDATFSWGKSSSFDDVGPGEFSFVLDNRDGRFTPGNTVAYVNPPIEGMTACWQLNTRLVSGAVTAVEVIFRDDESARSQVRITCNDMLANAARNNVKGGLANALTLAAAPIYYWPLSDDETAVQGAELSGNNGPALQPGVGGVNRITFGVDGVPAVGETQVSFDTVVVPKQLIAGIGSGTSTGTAYYLAGWITESTANSTGYLSVYSYLTAYTLSTNATGQFTLTDGTNTVTGPQCVANVPAFAAIQFTLSSGPPVTATATLWVNGVSYGTTPSITFASTVLFLINQGGLQASIGVSGTSDSAQFSHVSLGKTLIHEEIAGVSTEAVRLAAIATTTPEISLATLPSDLSTEPVGVSNIQNTAALDALNDVMRSEQGYMDTVTTGTLTAPVQKIRIRARNRPAAVSYTYDNEADLSGSPQFARDFTNTVSSVDSTGPAFEVTASDATLIPRVGSANDSIDVIWQNYADVYTAGSDRIARGANKAFKVTSIVVDALNASTSRWANLLAAVPGDRIRISGLPSTQLGFSTWDGWLIGCNETHNTTSNTFELLLDPCTPIEAIYDTGTSDGNRYMSGGILSLSSSITNVATSMSVATSDGVTKLSTTAVPYLMQIDNEIVNVTAVSAATPQVATITRAQSGTTAAAHSAGALPDMATPALYAY